jgi:four helix bundle protein
VSGEWSVVSKGDHDFFSVSNFTFHDLYSRPIHAPKLTVMFLQLAHTKLEVYKFSQALSLECYRITSKFPSDEKFAMVQQIRRAAISVHLNLSEGCSRKSQNERNRYFEIARGSVIEIDSAIGIACKLNYVKEEDLSVLGESIVKSFKLLTGMIKYHESPN